MTNDSAGYLERRFRLKENGTTIKIEITAGATTFITMAYILAVNPLILSEAGMDKGAVFTATAPALIIVGLFMIGSVVNIDFEDFTEGFPAFLAIIVMPLLIVLGTDIYL